MSSSNTRTSAQGPTLPPLRSLQQSDGTSAASNKLPPLRRPTQASHRATNSLGGQIGVAGLTSSPQALEFPNTMHRDIAISMAAQEGLSRSVEKAFNVYNDRLRADLRDFRGLCTSLVAREQQEAMKWYSLCLKVMKERDIARQQLHLLSLERNAGSSTSPPASPGFQDHVADLRAPKRGREDVVLGNSLERTLQSPVGSPARMSTSPPPFNNSPSSTPSSASAITPTSPLSNPQFPVDHRPGKRRKSCEAMAIADVSSPHVKQQSRTPSPLSFPGPLRSLPTQQPTPSSPDFSHVDLMYVPMNGALVCRACILSKSKSPATTTEPKSFPTTASWDDLRQHCLKSHPEACADVARLCPAEIFELRRRLSV